jgi:hypothetical protein
VGCCFWVVRLTISGSAETIRVIKTVMGVSSVDVFFFLGAQKGCGKKYWKDYDDSKHQSNYTYYMSS